MQSNNNIIDLKNHKTKVPPDQVLVEIATEAINRDLSLYIQENAFEYDEDDLESLDRLKRFLDLMRSMTIGFLFNESDLHTDHDYVQMYRTISSIFYSGQNSLHPDEDDIIDD